MAWNISSRVVLTVSVICSRSAMKVFSEMIFTSFSWPAEPISGHCLLCDCSVLSGGWLHFLLYVFWGKVCLLPLWCFNYRNLSFSSFPILLHVKIPRYKWLIIASAQFTNAFNSKWTWVFISFVSSNHSKSSVSCVHLAGKVIVPNYKFKYVSILLSVTNFFA